MMLPQAGRPLGACALAPSGLGTVAITKLNEANIENLIAKMGSSKAVSDIMEKAAGPTEQSTAAQAR
eukprot:2836475-Pyramimonas_sp.AAC.1